MRINNHREPRQNEASDPSIAQDESLANAEDSKISGEEEKVQQPVEGGSSLAFDSFAIEDIPTKIPIVDPVQPDHEVNLIAYHTGKFY